MDAITGIPEPTLRRLPAYCQYLRRLAHEGAKTVSCTDIGRELHSDPTQVRKDLAVTGIVGRPKVGYQVDELYGTIKTFLGWNNAQDAFLVGVGSLGAALLGYTGFTDHGLQIVAGFDVDETRAGQTVHGRPIYPVDKLPGLARRMQVHLGVITVPAAAAQSVADLMVEGGIRAIWNFAPTAIKVPEGIIVQTENLFPSLGVLSSKLAALLREENAAEELEA